MFGEIYGLSHPDSTGPHMGFREATGGLRFVPIKFTGALPVQEIPGIGVYSSYQLYSEAEFMASQLGIPLGADGLPDSVAEAINMLEPLPKAPAIPYDVESVARRRSVPKENFQATWLLLFELSRISVLHSVAVALQ